MTTATDTLRTDAIAQYRVLGEETDPGLEALARLAATVRATSAAAVNLIDDRLQHTVAVVGIQPGVCRRDDSMCAVVFEDGQAVVVDDARADARFADNPFVTGPLGHVRFYASSPLITPDGVAIGTLCVFGDDVAELNATQAEGLELLARQAVDVLELRRHSHELVRSNDQLTQFAARISHDLRNPLTAIAGQIELAADALAADDTEGAIRSLSHAEAAAGRMDGMITSLLAFARLGGARPQRAAVRLSDIVADALDDLESAIEGTHAVVTVDAPSDGLVSGDPALLRVLVQNLVANAVKFTQAAGVSPSSISPHALPAMRGRSRSTTTARASHPSCVSGRFRCSIAGMRATCPAWDWGSPPAASSSAPTTVASCSTTHPSAGHGCG